MFRRYHIHRRGGVPKREPTRHCVLYSTGERRGWLAIRERMQPRRIKSVLSGARITETRPVDAFGMLLVSDPRNDAAKENQIWRPKKGAKLRYTTMRSESLLERRVGGERSKTGWLRPGESNLYMKLLFCRREEWMASGPRQDMAEENQICAKERSGGERS
jgi:hypothetical protein